MEYKFHRMRNFTERLGYRNENSKEVNDING